MIFNPFLMFPDAVAALLLAFITSEPIAPDGAAPTAKPSALSTFEQVLSDIQTSERFWTAPYVIADIETQTVLVWGDHAGMIPGDPLEFFVISEKSGHDYEALMVSYAHPSDIQKALEKIGLSAGGPVDTDNHRFWPRGDRVLASFIFAREDEGTPVEMKAEAFCVWQGNPMPVMPWVFTGSPMLPSRENEAEKVYAADAFSPNSIASTFNLRATVFDLPLQGSKTAVYGDFILDPEWTLAEGRPMFLKLRPAPATTFPAEVDVRLHLSKKGITAEGIRDFNPEDLADVGALLTDTPDTIYFLTVDFHDDLSVTDATALARELQLLEQVTENIRINPPPVGQMFYKSFVPDPRFRDRQKRPSQPIELHIGSEKAAVMDLEEIWGDSRIPDIVETQLDFNTPENWVRYITNLIDRKPVLFVYAPADMPLDEVRKWTEPVLEFFPVVFVYKNQG